jgi:hypothetical protein
MNKPELFARNMRYRYLAAMCMAECQEWDACLSIIGAEDIPETLAEQVSLVSSRLPRTLCICLLCCEYRLICILHVSTMESAVQLHHHAREATRAQLVFCSHLLFVPCIGTACVE